MSHVSNISEISTTEARQYFNLDEGLSNIYYHDYVQGLFLEYCKKFKYNANQYWKEAFKHIRKHYFYYNPCTQVNQKVIKEILHESNIKIPQEWFSGEIILLKVLLTDIGLYELTFNMRRGIKE